VSPPAPRPPHTRAASLVRTVVRGGPVTIALLGLAVVALSGDWSPAVGPEVAKLRVWMVARSAGVVSFVLVTALTLLGLILAHPTNRTEWKASKHIFPWHRNLALFTLAFVAMHIVALAMDPYAGVGIAGSFIPGLSGYRTWEVALGTIGLYALLVTGLTARFTNLLPRGRWLTVHRVSLIAFALTWVHGVSAGSDSTPLVPMYAFAGALVALVAATRYWNPGTRPSRGEPVPERRLAPRLRIDLWR
jgi:sulfoxide reductase heme-binding subunit YedZ